MATPISTNFRRLQFRRTQCSRLIRAAFLSLVITVLSVNLRDRLSTMPSKELSLLREISCPFRRIWSSSKTRIASNPTKGWTPWNHPSLSCLMAWSTWEYLISNNENSLRWTKLIRSVSNMSPKNAHQNRLSHKNSFRKVRPINKTWLCSFKAPKNNKFTNRRSISRFSASNSRKSWQRLISREIKASIYLLSSFSSTIASLGV